MRYIASADEFHEALSKAEKPLIVDFWADWCKPCLAMNPILDDLERRYGDDIKFAKVNVDDVPEVAEQAGVMGIPTLILFRNGEEAGRLVGGRPREQVERFVKGALK